MNKKIWGVIIIILALAIIAGIIYFFFFYKPLTTAEPAVSPTPTKTTGALQPNATLQPAAEFQPVSPLKKAEVNSDDLARMASAFAERYGSFSNQSDYGNLRDLQIFMTESLRTSTQNYIDAARLKKADSSIYYGVATKSILSEVKLFDADSGRAEILVKTQRRESTGVSGNSAAFYQDIIIKYSRVGSVWRVDGASWQEK